MPQLIEPPDGAFAGALAAQTLRAGAFRSVALQPAAGVIDTLPAWTEHDARQPVRWPGDAAERPVREALTLCLPRRSGTRGGFEWASDRTSAQDPLQRIGALRRLLAQVMRHARRVGDDFAWEPSNEATWFRLRAALDALGRRIVRAGALDDSRGDGWVVICDRRTMLAADIDAGRLIAQIHLRPALPIERIVVTLTLRDGAAASFARAA
jgi:phage tail sheath protein FI